MMKPSASYVKLQSERQSLIEQNAENQRRDNLYDLLEAEFMATWQFSPDRLRLSARLREAIGFLAQGFDHCSYYTGEHDQRIIVTQPYGDCEATLKRCLNIGGNLTPEIIVADEWAFYNPGRAGLVIIRFPYGYDEALEKFKSALDRGLLTLLPA